VIQRLLKSNRSALVELPQLLADARTAGQLEAVAVTLTARLAREHFVRDMFAADGVLYRVTLVWRAREVAASTRLRVFVYASCPSLLAPLFVVKRLLARSD